MSSNFLRVLLKSVSKKGYSECLKIAFICTYNLSNMVFISHIDGLVQDRRNSSALAMELRLFALTHLHVVRRYTGITKGCIIYLVAFCLNRPSGLYADPSNCNKYYNCPQLLFLGFFATLNTQSQLPFLITCPTGTRWVQLLQQCTPGACVRTRTAKRKLTISSRWNGNAIMKKFMLLAASQGWKW